MAIAYLALCALHELDADAETRPFRQVRLELHHRLDPQAAPPKPDDAGRPSLRLVR